jgi:hypothetical protein
MKELNKKNKFSHKVGSHVSKVAILDPLEGCMVRTRNWIRSHSRIDNKGQLVTSNSEVTNVIGKIKTFAAK